MMAKINEQKRIQRPRTESEMLAALSAFKLGKQQYSNPPQVDDDDIVLRDCIEELIEARKTIEEMRGFVSVWYARFNRR